MAIPSYVAVARSTSSSTTRLSAVAQWMIVETSVISTRNVLRPLAISSAAPIRVLLT